MSKGQQDHPYYASRSIFLFGNAVRPGSCLCPRWLACSFGVRLQSRFLSEWRYEICNGPGMHKNETFSGGCLQCLYHQFCLGYGCRSYQWFHNCRETVARNCDQAVEIPGDACISASYAIYPGGRLLSSNIFILLRHQCIAHMPQDNADTHRYIQ